MEAQTRRRRILVAEDNPSDVFLIQHALQQNKVDAEILLFDNGETAASYFESASVHQVDLMLLDFHLPRRDGTELLRHLQASGIEGIPVIVMSSSSAKADRQEAEACGAHYFVKPTSLDEFMQLGVIVKRALGMPANDPPADFRLPVETREVKSGR